MSSNQGRCRPPRTPHLGSHKAEKFPSGGWIIFTHLPALQARVVFTEFYK